MSKLPSLSGCLRAFLLLSLLGLAYVVFATPTGLTPLAPRAVIDNREAAAGEEGEEAEIGEYFQYRFDQMKDASGTIPDGALMKALTQRVVMVRQQASRPQPDVAGIDNVSWTYAGPGNVGGRIRAILPINATTVFVGGVSGGIWKTTNCCSTSTTWSSNTDFMANLAVSTLIVDPTNPLILYAGTGEGFNNSDAVRGAGVFKSTDGGNTWAQLASTNDPNWYFVNRLAISPNGVNLLAATGTGLYHSTDGGATWTRRVTGGWRDVKFDPANSNNAVAGGVGYSWYTTNPANTWAAATGLPTSGRVELAYAPSSSDPSIVYASVDQNSGDVYKSTDGGHSYVRVNTGTAYLGNQGGYDNTIWVKPDDPNTVVVAGLDIYRSIDGGVTFTKISYWGYSWSLTSDTPSPHADHHALVSMPGSSIALLNGNDGGLYYTADILNAGGGTHYNSGWVYLNNNLGITQFYGVAGNNNGVLYGGSQDNGVTRYTPTDGANAWVFANGGDGGKSAADPTNPNYLYNEYIYGKVNRSTASDGTAEDIWGNYWNGSAWVCRAAPYRIDDACNGNGVGTFIAPILLDPNNANRLFVGDLSLWVTNDVKTPYVYNSATGGPQWTAIKPSTGSGINAIAVAPSNSDVIWVGHKNGQIYVTTNGTGATPAWTRVDTNIGTGNPGTVMVGSIAIDRNNSNIVYVGFTGFSGTGIYNLWRTTNGGSSWTQITNNLPNAPIYAVAINPLNSAWLYVGTEVGIFASVDTGANWNVPTGTGKNGDGPANVATFDLQWMGGGNSYGTSTLIAGSHGRGAWTATTISSSNTYADSVAHTCAGNSPCYSTLADAIGTAAVGGSVTVYAGTYAETVAVKSNVTVNMVGNVTIKDLYLHSGSVLNAGSATLNADNVTLYDGGTVNAGSSILSISDLNLAAGSVWNANSSTLTVRGNFSDNPLSFAPGSGTVILGGTTQTLQKNSVAYSDDLSSMTGWQVLNPNGGSTWGFTTWTGTPNTDAANLHARSWPDTVVADDWLISPGFALRAGTAYTILFKYGTSSASRPEKIGVFIGSAQTVGAMTNQVFDNSNITATTWQQGSGTFTPVANGTYYVGFHCYSNASMGYPAIDDLVVTAVDSDLRFNNLSLANGSTASVANNVVVQGNVSIAAGGTLALGAYGLSVEGDVANNGTLVQTRLVNAASTTFLNLKNSAGTVDKYWGAIIDPGAGNMGSTTVTVRGNQFCSGANAGVSRCFDIAPTTPLPAAVTFYYTEAERNGGDNAAMLVHHWNGSLWEQEMGTITRGGSGDGQWVQVTGIDAYSPFALAPASPTAVNIEFFTAERVDDAVRLAWETVSEIDNAGFNLYRAVDDGSDTLAWVRLNTGLIPSQSPGSSAGYAYEWLDATAASNVRYRYRMDAVDLHGSVKTVGTVTVEAVAPSGWRVWLPLIGH